MRTIRRVKMRVRRVRHRKHMAELELFQRDYDWERTAPRGERIVILFYNRMYGRWPEPPPGGIPDRFEITTDPWRMREADAVVFHIPSLGALTRVRKFPGQLWVARSIECPAHYPRLRDPDFLSRFDLTMGYERSADVVTPYYRPELRELLRTPPRPKSDERLSVLFLSEPHEVSGRIAFARELMGEMEVHSYGRQLSNRRLRWDRGPRSKLKTIADYKFTLAFENAIAPDYVTEKFFNPLIAGSVPVYLGAPNVDELAPAERCYIDTADFSGPKDLARRLRELGEDEDAYGEYLAWKQRPLRPSLLALLDEQRVPPLVRLCEAVGARLSRPATAGLGGDELPSSQAVG